MSILNNKFKYRIFNACLMTLRDGIVYARSFAYTNEPHEKIADLLDAIHNIPDLLRNFEYLDEQFLKNYFLEYDRRWKHQKDDFSLRDTYEKHLKNKPLGKNDVKIDSSDDITQERISYLIANYFYKISQSLDNLKILYRDKHDKRYWELYNLEGKELIAPFGLRYITEKKAKNNYGIMVG